MDSSEQFDVIICGTGLYNCILGILLAHSGKKVLSLDQNAYYGGEFPTKSINDLWKRFRPNEQPPKDYGLSRHWNVDMAPRFLISNSKLQNIFISKNIDPYFEHTKIENQYIYCRNIFTLIHEDKQLEESKQQSNPESENKQNILEPLQVDVQQNVEQQKPIQEESKIEEKQLTDSEAQQLLDKQQNSSKEFAKIVYNPLKEVDLNFIQSPIMEKFQNYFSPSEYNKWTSLLSMIQGEEFNQEFNNLTFGELIDKYEICQGLKNIILMETDIYRDERQFQIPACIAWQKIKNYLNEQKKQFLYPFYGSSCKICLFTYRQGYIEACSRFSAIQGGTFILNIKIKEIQFDSTGKFSGVRIDTPFNQLFTSPWLIADHEYLSMLTDKVTITGQIIRCICILNHPIPNIPMEGCSIVIPSYETGRKNNIYIVAINKQQQICLNPYQVVTISTIVETDNPQNEVQPALDILGEISEKFFHISEIYEQLYTNKEDNILMIRQNYATFAYEEEELDQVFALYQKIMGEEYKFRTQE